MKRKMIFVLLLIIVPINVFGLKYGGCEYSVVSRMQSIVTNINISYDYHVTNNVVYFDITLNNLTSDIYFYDTISKKEYYYKDTNNGEITIRNYTNYGSSGVYKFYSNISECYKISVGTKYYKIPNYNPYHNDELCKGFENYVLCNKWAPVNYSYDKFKNEIRKYKTEEKQKENKIDELRYEKRIIDFVVDFYIKYYYIILISIIIVFSFIILIKRRKDKFKL